MSVSGGVLTATIVKGSQRLELCLDSVCASYEHWRVECFHFEIFACVCVCPSVCVLVYIYTCDMYAHAIWMG